VIPAAERAIASGSPDDLVDVLCAMLRVEVERRHRRVMALARHAEDGVAPAREYVQAMLGLEVWAHGVYRQLLAHAHGTHA
jgi:hypothetical protein